MEDGGNSNAFATVAVSKLSLALACPGLLFLEVGMEAEDRHVHLPIILEDRLEKRQIEAARVGVKILCYAMVALVRARRC
jgi:hypothetical protein